MMSRPLGGVSSSSTHLIHVDGLSNRIRDRYRRAHFSEWGARFFILS